VIAWLRAQWSLYGCRGRALYLLSTSSATADDSHLPARSPLFVVARRARPFRACPAVIGGDETSRYGLVPLHCIGDCGGKTEQHEEVQDMRRANAKKIRAWLSLALVVSSAGSRADEWSWIDGLPSADGPTKKRLSICAASAVAHLSSVRSVAFEFEGRWEQFHPPIPATGKPNIEKHDCRGTVKYLKGGVRYYITFDPGQPGEWSNWVLRNDKMLAFTAKHEVHDRFLYVDLPPSTFLDWDTKHYLFSRADPKWLFGGFIGSGSASLRQLAQSFTRIESEETAGLIHLTFKNDKVNARADLYCDARMEYLTVKGQAGEMKGQGYKVNTEYTWEWQKHGQDFFPSHFDSVNYVGPDSVPVREYDLHFTNVRINASSNLDDSQFVLDALGIPDGVVGVDRRSRPVGSLISVKGKVREVGSSQRSKISQTLKDRLDFEQKNGAALAESEAQAQATLTYRRRWTVATYLCIAVAGSIAAFMCRRIFVRRSAKPV
jgi:hypothetical protein